MILIMNIEQTDNGWILTYEGHDCLDKRSVHKHWKSVIKELNEYFGFFTFNGERTKDPTKAL